MRENIPSKIQTSVEDLKKVRSDVGSTKMIATVLCTLFGTILAIYVAGWLMILMPLKQAFTAFMLGALTRRMVLITAIKCAFSLTTGGAIWCGGYILSRKIIGYEEC